MEPDRLPAAPAPALPQDPAGRRLLVGLDLDGETLRYAAVAHTPSETPELIRLGAATFGYDIAAAAFGVEAEQGGADALGRALRQALRGDRPDVLQVVVHAPHLPTYFVPVAEGVPAAERYDRLRRETLLLADAEAEPVLRVRSRPLRLSRVPRRVETDGQMVWHRTLLIPGAVHERMAALARQVGAVGRGGPRYELADGAEAAAVLVLEAESERRPAGPDLALAVGLYAGGAELGIFQSGRLYLSRRIEAGPRGASGLMDDVAYFSAALLASLHLDAEQLGRIYLYGPAAGTAETDGLADLFAADVQPLGAAVPFRAGHAPIDPAFVPAVGAALAEL